MVFCCINVSSYKQDSVWSWFICFCTTTCMILTIGFIFSLGVLLPVFMDSFKENRERTAWVSSVTLGAFLFIGPAIGVFVNRFGCRLSTIIGCLTCSVALALGSVAPNIVVLYLAFSLLFGVGNTFVYISAPVIITQYFTKRRSIALGFVTAGQGLGTMICGPVLQALVGVLDWRNTFRIFSGVLALSSLTGCLISHGNQQPTSTSSQGEKKNHGKFGCDLSIWKNPIFVVLLVMGGLGNFSRMVPYVHLIKHCDDLGIPADKSSTLFLFIGVFAAVGRLSAGCLCNMKRVNSLFLYQAAVFVMGASTMLFLKAKTYAPLAAVVVVFSLADGLMVSTYIIVLFRSVQVSQRAPCLGFGMMAGGIFIVCSPPLSGYLADKFGNYVAAFLMGGSIAIVASFIPFVLRCVERKSDRGDHVAYLEELMDKDEKVPATCSRSRNEEPSKKTYHIELESPDPIRTTSVRVSSKRPVSYMCAVENPFIPITL